MACHLIYERMLVPVTTIIDGAFNLFFRFKSSVVELRLLVQFILFSTTLFNFLLSTCLVFHQGTVVEFLKIRQM